MTSDRVAEVERWLGRTVVGLDLCPFAAAPLRRDAVRIVESDAPVFASAMRAVLDEAEHLLRSPETETTLVVFGRTLPDFEDILELIDALELAFDDVDLTEEFQLVAFHPDCRFEGAPADDPANYTNRAPYPIVQLLRVASVADVIDRHPDIDAVFRRNVELLREMGLEAVRELWKETGEL